MASANQAERRLKRILNWKGHTSMGLKRSLAVAIIACTMVLVCVVAAARPAQESQATPAPAASAPWPDLSAARPSPQGFGGLPRRLPMASMAPQLRENRTGASAPHGPPPGRSPEQARALLTSIRQGWRSGLNDAGATPDNE